MKHEHEHREHEHHERHHRETGGRNDAEEDLRDKPEARTNAKKIDDEAEEKKRGGRAKRKRGGEVRKHHVDHEGRLMKKHGGEAEKRHERKRGGRMPEHAKHVEVHGEHEKHRADRKPRKDGGRTGADEHPFSSARKGTLPTGRKEMQME
jgi:hypothetical protein